MRREETATLYVVEDAQVLLLFHEKHQKWLPPGGHLEKGELPHEGALRETREETGLEVKLIAQENLWLKYPNAQSIYRPYLCLLEELPSHQHIDFIYVGQPCGGTLVQAEGSPRWFTFEEVERLGDVVFPDTIDVVRHLFAELFATC